MPANLKTIILLAARAQNMLDDIDGFISINDEYDPGQSKAEIASTNLGDLLRRIILEAKQ